MNSISQPHRLLILSQHSETYEQLIEQKNLPGLSITALGNPNQVITSGHEYDLVFGEPSLISQVLNRIKNVKWVQSSWAGVEPLLQPAMRCDYILTNIRNVYGPMMSEFVFGYMLMIERRILPRWQSQLRGEWDDQPYDTLHGKLFGLLGVGTIGRAWRVQPSTLGCERSAIHDRVKPVLRWTSISTEEIQANSRPTWITWYAACRELMKQKG